MGLLDLFGFKNKEASEANLTLNSAQLPKQIKILGLPDHLQNLQAGTTEFNFIGITSNGLDCIYFVKDKNQFQIEFEALIKEQLPIIEKFKEYGNSKGYKIVMTTYGNQPNYTELKEAPVVRLETNSDLKQTIIIGKEIQNMLFGNNEETIYDVVS